jgi:flagellar hook assembly protein FlgD
VRLPPTEDRQNTELRVAPSPFSVERDGGTRIRYRLDETPSLVRVQIFDARGRRVRTLEEARLSGPSGELVWNGRNDDGHRVRVGVYVVFLEAVRAENGSVVQLKTPVVVARPLG